MRITYRLLVALITGILFSCGSVVVISDKEAMAETKMEMELRDESVYSLPATPICQECFVVPKSGGMKDLRVGYYFDQDEGKCISITYSTGPSCIPPPFKSLKECLKCCGGN